MALYNKESLEKLKEETNDDELLLQNIVSRINSIRLETKLALVAIVETLMHKANYNHEGAAFLKVDNPMIVTNLGKLANKDVNKEKMEKYFNELLDAELISIVNKDLFVKVLND